MEIERELKDSRGWLDALIERHFPKELDYEYLEWLMGKSSTGYDPQTIQRAIFEPMWDLLARGGKRWRPWLFLVMANNLGVDLERYKNLAVIVELLHNGSLIADDIEDGAEVRRGDKAIHVKYGLDIAVNLSSAMYFLPMRLLMEMKVSDPLYRRLINAYLEDMIRIHLGQATDIGWHRGLRDPETIKVEHYLEMCANKTGVLPRMAARFAAIAAGLNEDQERKLGKFGESIGVAFQIQDDILNVTSAESLGKEFGEDIREGKVTLIVIYTLSRADERDKRRLKEILSMHTSDPELIKEAISIMERYGAIEDAKEVARRIVLDSWREAEVLLPSNIYKEKIKELAMFLVERKF
ncbi:MAG: polyprenyl synthetase family protein [Candidatus Korarchaeum sp.]|nr:polyprenyl synthetase family protein [Candidatus Korarchaeum sp.]MDW8034895.1 polyprenyl synthetase family protein [Candidatus Korarchaeum sp.]